MGTNESNKASSVRIGGFMWRGTTGYIKKIMIINNYKNNKTTIRFKGRHDCDSNSNYPK